MVIEENRTSNNYYGAIPTSNAKINVIELWHQRLDHMNYKSLSKLFKKELVGSLHKLDKIHNNIHRPFNKVNSLELIISKLLTS